ncbi:MAG TPA: hypothetical protein VMQ40_06225 [Acidimicrobiales bacterium]|jgi:hypothetical protein|nr:hypothetical protein [Acidimicrobiales bacterium]
MGPTRVEPTWSQADDARRVEPSSARRWALAVGAVAYLGIAAGMYAHVLALSVTRGTTCACSDVSLFAWFFEWPLAAIRSGHDPFYSSAMFHPQGINLLSNTSAGIWSFVLLPVTAIFGPFASLNVAVIAAPALSGVAAMWVAQRWVRSSVAAFLAGALYAFSPLVLFESAGSHLMVTSLVVPPLVLACLDELFWRRRHSPIKVGAVLGGLLVVQFFSGTELLVMLGVATALSLLVLGAAALIADRDAGLVAIRTGLPGLVTAAVLAVVVLAWPAWYALAGPGHYTGAVWPNLVPAQASIRSFFVAVPGQGLWWVPHWGRFMRPTYLGPPLIAAVLVGLVVFRRDARLRAVAVLTCVVAWLALGQRYAFSAWHALSHVSILNDVMNERFSALLFLPAGLALALVLDDLGRWRPRLLGAALAVTVGLACATPFVIDAVDALPYAASTVWVPTWYQQHAATLPPGQVVLGFPFFNTTADLLGVQALYGMRYAIVGGTGPEWLNSRQGKEAPGYEVIKQLASRAEARSFDALANAMQRAEVLSALRGWDVTLVVVPFERAPNTKGVARAPAVIEAWLGSVLGPPRVQSAAWVWHL